MPAVKARRIAESIRQRIGNAEWRQAGVLPNERALSHEYGVARNTIRRALLQLVAEGLLKRHVGRGTMIAASAEAEESDLRRTVRQLLRISPLDLTSMRMILEPQTAAAAAMAAGQEELSALVATHHDLTADADAVAMDAGDREFHAAVARATRNALLANLQDILNTLQAGLSLETRSQRSERAEADRIVRQHGEIVEAIETRDAEGAAEAMRRHLSERAGTLLAGGAAPPADAPPVALPASHPQPEPGIETRLLEIMERVSGTSPLDIMAVRLMIEPQVAAVAAANARMADIDSIREAHRVAVDCTGIEAFEHWDGILHKRLFESTRNDFLTALHDVLYVIRNRDRWMQVKRRAFSEERRARYCAEHEEICAAVAARNTAAASAAMKRHMLSVSMYLFGR